MTLVKWNSLNNFPTLSRVFDDFFKEDTIVNKWGRDYTGTVPSVNVKETENEFQVELAAPGLKKEDFKVNVENEILTISAENKVENESKDEKWTRREFSYSSFKRSFHLPKTVNGEKIEATYKDGILNILIPKKEEAKPKPAREIKIA